MKYSRLSLSRFAAWSIFSTVSQRSWRSLIASPSSVPLAIPRTQPCTQNTDASGHAPRTTADRWGAPDSANHRVVPLRVLLHNLIHDLAGVPVETTR